MHNFPVRNAAKPTASVYQDCVAHINLPLNECDVRV
jgi:hypothetical protein